MNGFDWEIRGRLLGRDWLRLVLRLAAEVDQNGISQGGDVFFKGRVYGVQPVGVADVVAHGAGGLCILDAEGDDDDALVKCLVDLV